MIKFKGTTLYPPALYDVLENIPGVNNYIIEVFTGSLGTDQIVLRIGSTRRDEAFEKEIKDTFRSKVRDSTRGGLRTGGVHCEKTDAPNEPETNKNS